MKKSLIKNTFREIKNTKARFLSILAIIALGCGFYCGIKATAPSMNNMAQSYYSRTNLMDYRLVSTVGFDGGDVGQVEKLDGVTCAEAGYFVDAVSDFCDSAHEVRLISVNDKLNSLTVIDGRLPERKGEIAVEDGNFLSAAPEIGDTVRIEKKAGDSNLKDALSVLEFKVVGVVRSPLYISYERGSTTVGDGALDTFMYADKSSFSSQRFTELYVKTSYSDSSDDESYSDNIDAFKSKLKKVGRAQSEAFKAENIDEAQQTLDEKRLEYTQSKEEAEKKLSDAKKQLEEAQETYNLKIKEARQQLSSAESELSKGYGEYYSAKREYESKIKKAEEKLRKAEKKYKKGKKDYNSGLKQYRQGLEEYEKSYKLFYSKTKPDLEEKLKAAKLSLAFTEEALKAVEQELNAASDPDTRAELTAQQKELTAQKLQLEDGTAQLEGGIRTGESSLTQADKKLKASKLTLDKAKKKLSFAEKKIKNGKAELKKARLQGKQELENAYALLRSNEEKLNRGKAELEESRKSGLKELKKGKNEYKASKATVNTKLAKAEKKLNSAQKKLDKLSDPEWYVFTRKDNPGYSAFSDNTGRLDAIAAVFPVFFLLVAVLVCLTTMTRLVDEKRTEIGTLKALGYSNGAIAGKFLIYATTAGVIGAGLGIVIGVNVLPHIIYNAYKIMYNMDEITVVADGVSVALNIAVAILCTTAVSGFACYKALRRRPAKLMRPKGPKPGKRILLERITPVWKRLGFTSKVTARNLFRYKSRMLMTVLGVAGCTALIVAAFGLQDSLTSIASIQFEEIYTYNAIVVADKPLGENSRLNEDIKKSGQTSAVVAFAEGKVQSESAGLDDAVNVCVPENTGDFSKLVNLRTREKHTPLKLNDSGVIISEKLSGLLGVSAGDSIRLTVDGVKKSLKISAVSEQYTGHYVYMAPALYEKNYGAPEYSTVFTRLEDNEKAQSDFGNQMLKRSDVAAVSFLQSSIDEFYDMLSSMNMVVFIMIFCAGALAFVVLYNLTNINIAERVREIATIKVLGFDNRETSSFIYRENIVLLIIGIASGLVMGTFLSGWIVSTVEVDAVMFGRTIDISSYIWAALLTVAFALFVNFIMYFKMKRINMVESLKSVE